MSKIDYKTRVALLRETLKKREDTEHEQSLIRLALASGVVIYLLSLHYIFNVPIHATTALVAFSYATLSLLIFFHIVAFPTISVPRRIAGMALDLTAVTTGMYLSGYYASPFYGGYLWLSIASGIRYGSRYLYFAVGLSVTGFSLVLTTSEFWKDHLLLGGGLIVWIILLPIYVVKLLNRLETALKQAEKASESKSVFLTNMSHELRTPLTAINGFGELMKDYAIEQKNEEQINYANIVTSSSHHLHLLINQLLDLSKIEAGKMTTAMDQVKLSDLLLEVESTVRTLVSQNNNQLQCNIITPIITIQTDRLKLKQILFNLLGNACKFTENGNITLTVSDTIENNVHWILFEVKDTGIGISEEQQEKLFESFSQADPSTTRKYGGTGLGLSLSKKLAELLGGTVDVVSFPNKGSSFTVKIPAMTTATDNQL